MKKNFSLSGVPDFNPVQMKRREYIISIMKEKFNLFGFLPIETGILEKRSNLIGSYGEEGDKLIFQLLKSGDFLSKVTSDITAISSQEISKFISDKALRYDLTLPFTRFVAMKESEINFPFRRYEIGPVFRADRAQKGRFRQFTQCDVDIIGSTSLWLELDLLNLMSSIFNSLGLEVVVKVNNRKILEGIFQAFTNNLSFSQFCVIIDKLDKISFEKVSQLLLDGGFNLNDVEILNELLCLKGSLIEKKEFIISKIDINEQLENGFNELDFIINNNSNELKDSIDIDFSLARGLDYYTGSIFEACSLISNVGSLLGGGRYDQLSEKFNVKNASGVGMSFGLDRLYLALQDSNLFPKSINNSLEIMFVNFGFKEAQVSYKYIMKLRKSGFDSFLFPDCFKLNKQMNYANKRGVNFVVIIGEKEVSDNNMTIKNMLSGKQKVLVFKEFLSLLIDGKCEF